MDPHFREYLAAVAGMQETYGFGDDHDGMEIHGLKEPSPEGRPAVGEPAAVAVGGC